MRYYSKIINRPHVIIEEQRNGFQLINQKKLCTFENGVLDTEDPKVIEKLEKRTDLFSTTPWDTAYSWRNTEEGIKLLKEGERLGIKCKHIREEYLKKLIADSKPQTEIKEEVLPEPERVEMKEIVEEEEIVVPKPTTPEVKINYKELMKIAKKEGVKGFGKKKKELERILKNKGVI